MKTNKKSQMMTTFFAIVVMQLFFSVAINIMTYSTPDDALKYVTAFSGTTSALDLENTATDVQDSLSRQTNIPIVDVGALVFYSGNIILDLLLNFAFAIPQMITLVFSGLLLMFSINTGILQYVQLFLSVIMGIWYFVSIISFLSSIRSGRVI